ncbi:TatD family hydrolase [bacterium]|jgi:TatD DNase family protein|nr:TatD family hydrolase [Verrucomicrobiales bacterium]MDB4526952.1 TatD family hydrolase [bacterium]MDC0312392.1 TatD family hydrolase [Verrucomicrobiales bacterium]MDC0504195.1 TatD family hydrolase [Verrucomicrobiales bacterium]MDC3255146.1 TatD family hydrolase [bacterium]
MIDAHLHLQDPRLLSEADTIVETCREVGISRLIVNGTRPDDWSIVTELAERFPEVHASFGLHPWYVNEAPTGWEALLEDCLHQGAVGVGEIGLDQWIRGYDIDLQKACFKSQLRMGVARQLPVTIHCLQAWGHLLECLQTEPLPGQGVLLHSYGGPVELIDAFVELGAYFSVSGYFFHERKRTALEALVERVPRERLLLETDAPDMALPDSDIRFSLAEANHPANLVAIYTKVADMLGYSRQNLVEQTRHNARRLFGTSL